MTTINHRQSVMLRAFAHSPKPLTFFTSGNASGLSPHTAQMYADHLVTLGYVSCDDRGTYAATDLGVAYLNRPAVAPSRLIGAWSTPPGSYQPPSWQSTRSGADDHRQFRSLTGTTKREHSPEVA
jgi:hypothetical protein